MEECRKPMGLRKDLHIKSMLFDDTNVYRRWLEKYGRTPEQQDVDNLFKDFVPNAAELSGKNTVGLFRVQKKPLLNCHKRLGSTTGFTRSMVDILERTPTNRVFFFDCTVAGDEVVTGWRPYPHMVYKNMDILGIQNPKDMVKVDDTVVLSKVFMQDVGR
jgi:phosphonoacetaldehyde hydrolase